MNTYDYMYDVLKLRGEINISFQQLAALRDEGIPFFSGYRCDEREGLTLKCEGVIELEQQITNMIRNSGSMEEVIYITDIWKWKYLIKEYAVDNKDGGVHFLGLAIYYKEVEEDDN